MSIDPNVLERLNRDELIAKARQLGAKRAELLTRPELRDEIIRLSADSEEEGRRARGWFGVARDLVASVVGQGLNLPDTADLIRGVHVFAPKAAAPVATVTLAEIYAAQGHVAKALDLLDEVLVKEPDHEAARQARERWAQSSVQDSLEDASALVDGPEALDASSAEASDSQAAAQNDTFSPEGFAAQGATEPTILETIVAREAASSEQQAAAAWDASGVAESGLAVTPALPRTRRESTEDRLVVLRHEDESILCDWELTPMTMDRLRSEAPTGVLTLRTVEVVASWDGPVTHQNDIELSESAGHCSVVPLGAGNEMRIVLGWRTEPGFLVLALGAEFAWDRMTGASLRWAPPHTLSPDAWQRLGGAMIARLRQGTSSA